MSLGKCFHADAFITLLFCHLSKNKLKAFIYSNKFQCLFSLWESLSVSRTPTFPISQHYFFPLSVICSLPPPSPLLYLLKAFKRKYFGISWWPHKWIIWTRDVKVVIEVHSLDGEMLASGRLCAGEEVFQIAQLQEVPYEKAWCYLNCNPQLCDGISATA